MIELRGEIQVGAVTLHAHAKNIFQITGIRS
jgi:hypothetical protein